jgi:putative sigma-54 modulation protein
MNLNITARHIELTPAISDYVRRKVDRAERYLDNIIWAQAILSVEKHRQIAEFIVHTPGNTFRTKGESTDLYAAVDMASHKLDIHLSRVKDKKRQHRGVKGEIPLPEDLVPSANGGSLAATMDDIAEVSTVELEPLTLKQAVRRLNTSSLPFLLFINERNSQVSALYKKGKSYYGLVETVE